MAGNGRGHVVHLRCNQRSECSGQHSILRSSCERTRCVLAHRRVCARYACACECVYRMRGSAVGICRAKDRAERLYARVDSVHAGYRVRASHTNHENVCFSAFSTVRSTGPSSNAASAKRCRRYCSCPLHPNCLREQDAAITVWVPVIMPR